MKKDKIENGEHEQGKLFVIRKLDEKKKFPLFMNLPKLGGKYDGNLEFLKIDFGSHCSCFMVNLNFLKLRLRL